MSTPMQCRTPHESPTPGAGGSTRRRRLPGAAQLVVIAATAAALSGCERDRPTGPLDPGRTPGASAVVPSQRNARALAALRSSRSAGRDGPLFSASSAVWGDAIIGNGVVQLGINPEGHLNVPGGTLSSGASGTTYVGLRYVPTNGEATAPGCLCEGWGVADAATGVTSYADEDFYPSVSNMAVESFAFSATEATSVVTVGTTFRVTHHYRPSASPFLYEAEVTIQNISPADLADVRYTRTMDWDIAPNTFDEYVTIQGTASTPSVLYASNNGFNIPDPLGPRTDDDTDLIPVKLTGDFVDGGPMDHGAHFDFRFGFLAFGASKTFTIYYGATANEPAALAAVTTAGAELYSLGQANWDGTGAHPWEWGAPSGTFGATTGQPHTFIFAFKGVGGVPLDRAGPVTTNVATSGNPVPVGAPIAVTANVDDATTGGSTIASAALTVGGSPPLAMAAVDHTFDEVAEDVIRDINVPSTPGVYELCVSGTDQAGNAGEPSCILLVVYDPTGGFVTGGGWIYSPAGAYTPDPSLAGRADFGFVSKYKAGAITPSGQTQFQFKAGSLNFHSVSYEWLVVSGARAQYKGAGTINGAGDYGFLLTAVDGQITGGGGTDRFRLKIWDRTSNAVVYDNGLGASDDADAASGLKGGSIVIHK